MKKSGLSLLWILLMAFLVSAVLADPIRICLVLL